MSIERIRPADAEPSLLVSHPAGTRQRVPLRPLPFLIGRQSDNHLVLRDNRTSRRHARIVQINNDYYIEDLGSRHGVFVNGVRIERQKLAGGDRIHFGVADSYELEFVAAGDEGLNRLLERISAGSGDTPGGRLARLRSLMEVARSLRTALTTDDVFGGIVEAALAITGGERGFLLLVENGELQVRVGRTRAGAFLGPEDLRVPPSLIFHALRERHELLTMNFETPVAAAPGAQRPWDGPEVCSVVAVPLVRLRANPADETCQLEAFSDTVGLLYLDSPAQQAALKGASRELLQALAIEASTIVENARLLEQERLRQQLDEELELARRIQQDLLPSDLPAGGWFQAAGFSLPSREVGGDYYDVHRLSGDCWNAVVADVSGKGVDSALLAALLQGAFLTVEADAASIRALFARLNRYFLERTQGRKYATLFHAVFARNRPMLWTNAGHCPPLLVARSGDVTALPSNCTPVGLLETANFEVEERTLCPGDKLIIYTDGLSDAQNTGGETFGIRRIREIATAYRSASCSELASALREAALRHQGELSQADDITVLVVGYEA